ncbi:MAG: hypothetical protein GXX83_03900 [Gaiellales bacterium]|nr:hypothetical protein [Gaiellales bacterium]
MSEIGASSIPPLGHIEQWGSLALDYIEGGLTPVARSQVEAHLATCPACRALLEDQRVVAAALKAVEPARPPRHMELAVLSALGVTPPAATAAGRPDPVPAPTVPRPAPALPSFRRRLRAYLQPHSVAVAAAALVLVVVGALAISLQPELLQTGPTGPTARNTLAATTTVLSTQAAGADLHVEHEQVTTAEDSVETMSAPTSTTLTPSTSGTTTAATSETTEPPTTASLDVMAKYMGVPEPTWVELKQDGADPETTASAFGTATDLDPIPSAFWMGGPTFAVVVSASHVAGLMQHLQQLGFRLTEGNQPADTLGNALNGILAGYATYHRAEMVDDTLKMDVDADSWPEGEASLLVFFVTQ